MEALDSLMIDKDSAYSPFNYAKQFSDNPSIDMEQLADAYINDVYKPSLKSSGMAEGKIELMSEQVKKYFKDSGSVSNLIAQQNPQPVVEPVAQDNTKSDSALANFGGGVIQGVGGTVAATIQGVPELANIAVKSVIPDNFSGSSLNRFGVKQEDAPIVEGAREVASYIREATTPDFVDQSSLSATIGQGIGSAVGTLATGGVLGLAGKSSGIIALGMTGQSAAQLAGEGAYDYDQTTQGKGNEQDRSATILYNSFLSAFDAVHVGSIFRGAAKGFEPLVRDSAVKAMAKGATTEALTEMAQTIGQNLIANDLVAYDPERGTFEDLTQAGVGGASAGAFMTGLIRMIAKGRTGRLNTDPTEVDDPSIAPTVDEAEQAVEQEVANEIALSAISHKDLSAIDTVINTLTSDKTNRDKKLKTIIDLSATNQELNGEGVDFTNESAVDEFINQSASKIIASRSVLAEKLQSKFSSVEVGEVPENLKSAFDAAEAQYALPKGTLSAYSKITSNFREDTPAGLLNLNQIDNVNNLSVPEQIQSAARNAMNYISTLNGSGVEITPYTVVMSLEHGAGNFIEIQNAANLGDLSVSQKTQKMMDNNSGIQGIKPSEYLSLWQQQLGDNKKYAVTKAPAKSADDNKILNFHSSVDNELVTAESLTMPNILGNGLSEYRTNYESRLNNARAKLAGLIETINRRREQSTTDQENDLLALAEYTAGTSDSHPIATDNKYQTLKAEHDQLIAAYQTALENNDDKLAKDALRESNLKANQINTYIDQYVAKNMPTLQAESSLSSLAHIETLSPPPKSSTVIDRASAINDKKASTEAYNKTVQFINSNGTEGELGQFGDTFNSEQYKALVNQESDAKAIIDQVVSVNGSEKDGIIKSLVSTINDARKKKADLLNQYAESLGIKPNIAVDKFVIPDNTVAPSTIDAARQWIATNTEKATQEAAATEREKLRLIGISDPVNYVPIGYTEDSAVGFSQTPSGQQQKANLSRYGTRKTSINATDSLGNTITVDVAPAKIILSRLNRAVDYANRVEALGDRLEPAIRQQFYDQYAIVVEEANTAAQARTKGEFDSSYDSLVGAVNNLSPVEVSTTTVDVEQAINNAEQALAQEYQSQQEAIRNKLAQDYTANPLLADVDKRNILNYVGNVEPTIDEPTGDYDNAERKRYSNIASSIVRNVNQRLVDLASEQPSVIKRTAKSLLKKYQSGDAKDSGELRLLTVMASGKFPAYINAIRESSANIKVATMMLNSSDTLETDKAELKRVIAENKRVRKVNREALGADYVDAVTTATETSESQVVADPSAPVAITLPSFNAKQNLYSTNDVSSTNSLNRKVTVQTVEAIDAVKRSIHQGISVSNAKILDHISRNRESILRDTKLSAKRLDSLSELIYNKGALDKRKNDFDKVESHLKGFNNPDHDDLVESIIDNMRSENDTRSNKKGTKATNTTATGSSTGKADGSSEPKAASAKGNRGKSKDNDSKPEGIVLPTKVSVEEVSKSYPDQFSESKVTNPSLSDEEIANLVIRSFIENSPSTVINGELGSPVERDQSTITQQDIADIAERYGIGEVNYITQEQAAKIKKQYGLSKLRGYYSPSEGTINIYISDIDSIEEVTRVMLEEYAHSKLSVTDSDISDRDYVDKATKRLGRSLLGKTQNEVIMALSKMGFEPLQGEDITDSDMNQIIAMVANKEPAEAIGDEIAAKAYARVMLGQGLDRRKFDGYEKETAKTLFSKVSSMIGRVFKVTTQEDYGVIAKVVSRVSRRTALNDTIEADNNPDYIPPDYRFNADLNLMNQAVRDSNNLNGLYSTVARSAANSMRSLLNARSIATKLNPHLNPRGGYDRRSWYERNISSKHGLPEGFNGNHYSRHLDVVMAEDLKRAGYAKVNFEVHSDILELDATLQSIFNKNSANITDAEKNLFNEALQGNHRFTDPAKQSLVNLHRIKLDKSSLHLAQRIRSEIDSRINSLNPAQRVEAGRAILTMRQGQPLNGYSKEAKDLAVRSALVDKINSNMGLYIHRSYKAFYDPQWINKVRDTPAYENAVKFIANANGKAWAKEALDKGTRLTPERLDTLSRAEVTRLLTDAQKTASPMQFMLGGALRHSILRQKGDIPPAIREVLGEIKDPIFNYANTKKQIETYIVGHEYSERLRDIGLATGMISRVPTEEHTERFADAEKYPMLHNHYISRQNLEALSEFGALPPINDDILGGIIKVNSLIKYGKTVMSPTTIARNIMSGYFLMMSSGHPAALGNIPAAFSALTRGSTSKSLLTNKITLADDVAKDNALEWLSMGIIHDGAHQGEIEGILKDAISMDVNDITTPSKTQELFRKLNRVYGFGDDLWKIAAYEAEKSDLIKNGVDAEEAKYMAAKRIRDLMPTYSKVPNMVKMIRRVPLFGTFVSFPWEVMRNLKNSYKYAREDYLAGRTSMASKRIAGIAMAYAAPSAILAPALASLFDVDDEERDLLEKITPSYENGMLRLFTGNENGRLSWIDGATIIPSESIVAGFRTALEAGEDAGVATALGSGASRVLKPFLGIDMTLSSVLNILNNYDPNTGRSIYGQGLKFEDVMYSPYDQKEAFADMLAYLGRTLGAGFITNITDFYRANASEPKDEKTILEEVFGTGNQLSSSGREFTNADATKAMLGFRSRTFSVDQLIDNSIKGIKKEVDAASQRLKTSADQFVSMSDADLESLVESTYESRKKAFDKALTIIDYLRTGGKSDSEILKTLYDPKDGTLSKQHIESLLAGKYPVYEPTESLLKKTMRVINDQVGNSPDPNWISNQKAMLERFNKLNTLFAQYEESVN